MNIIQTDQAPAAIGPYSQAVINHGLLFVSGQLGLDPATGALADGIAAQTRRALQNLAAILAAAGLGPQHVLKATIYVASMDDFALVNQFYAEVFQPPFPAREVIQAARLPKNGLVEISAIAAAP
jgi:2-iminobutanoate/2-iminopropanoate deaminase